MRKEKEKDEYPSPYDAFALGDRVKRTYKNRYGRNKEYKGLVLAIGKDGVEVFWDTLDGRYRPNDKDSTFTNCSVDEIFKGNEEFTPIRKDQH